MPPPTWIATLPGFDPAKPYNHFDIAGARWQTDDASDHLYISVPPLDRLHGENRQMTIRASSAGSGYLWASNLVIDSDSGSYWSIPAGGRAPTVEEAALLAANHVHHHCVIDGTIWYAGRGCSGAIHWPTWEARLGHEVITVNQRDSGSWSWSRRIDLSGFKRVGIAIWKDEIGGACDTAEAAMRAALAAPGLVRLACEQYLQATAPAQEPEIIDFTLQANEARVACGAAK